MIDIPGEEWDGREWDMGCCDVRVRKRSDGKLICDDCNVPLSKTTRRNSASGRCVVELKCNNCGLDIFVDCGSQIKVKVDRGEDWEVIDA